MVIHLVRMGAMTILIALCSVYPFLPGGYDSLAMGLSTMAQTFGVFGLLLVPVGVLWLAFTLWKRAPGYTFALVSVVAASLVVVAVSFVGAASVGPSLGLLTLALWLYSISRLSPRLRLLKNAERDSFNPVPLYLMFMPVAVLLIQLVVAAPLTEFSRNYAISMSAELIDDIEAYRVVHGRYPSSLLAVWNDYFPSVVGIEQFQYAPGGDAYNLVFEQPRFLLDNIGAREFVVYNPLDEHVIISHNSWILILGPEEAEATQGWFAVHDASSPHWKYFWFD